MSIFQHMHDWIGGIFPNLRKAPLTDIAKGVMAPKRIGVDVSEVVDVAQRGAGAIPPLTLKETKNRLRPFRIGSPHLQIEVHAIGIVIAGSYFDLYAAAMKIRTSLYEIIKRALLFLRRKIIVDEPTPRPA